MNINCSKRTDIVTDEAQNAQRHRDAAPVVADLWAGGLNVYLRALDPINGLTTTSVVQEVQLTVLIRAWNNLYCARNLALQGHYLPSLNLLRLPIEEWMTYWYLRVFPGNVSRFIEQAPDTPDFNCMLQAIEVAQKVGADPVVRKWIKDLHKFSHIDSAGVRLALKSTEKVSTPHLGPWFDIDVFTCCAVEAVTPIVQLLEAVGNFCQVMGCAVDPAIKAYSDEAVAWLAGKPELSNVAPTMPDAGGVR